MVRIPFAILLTACAAARLAAVDAPTGLSIVVVTPNSIELSWTATAGASSYRVERSPDGASWSVAGRSSAVRFIDYGATASEAVYGLAAATSFRYRVIASGSGGDSSASAVVIGATAAGPASPPPTQLSFSAVAQDPSTVRCGWSRVAGAAGYLISRAPDAGGAPGAWTEIAFADAAPTAAAPFADTGLSPGSTWWYECRPYGAGGVGPVAVDIDSRRTTTKVAGVPPEHPGLMAVPWSPTRIDVSWLPVARATGYVLERSDDDGGTWAAIASPAAPAFSDSGLAPASAHRYRFRAVGAWGVPGLGQPSVAVAATTPAATSGRRLLQPRDLVYRGSFMPPFWLDQPHGITSSGTKAGIALRRVDGEVHLFSLSSYRSGELLYEFTPPPESGWGRTAFTADAYGTLVKLWGNPYQGRKLFYAACAANPLTAAGSTRLMDLSTVAQQALGPSDEYEAHGLCWDEATRSLYISLGEYYNVTYYNHPALLRTRLDDLTGAMAASGPWRVPNGQGYAGSPNNTLVTGGSLLLPQWFADAVLGAGGARRLGLGFGGEFSGTVINSHGPSLFALDPAALTDAAACRAGEIGTPGVDPHAMAADAALAAPVVPVRCLLSDHYDGVHFGTRPPGYDSSGMKTTPQELPSDGFGRWNWTDRINGGMCWIDDEAGRRGAHGVICASWFGFGRLGYKPTNVLTGQVLGGNGNDGGIACGFTVFDPADLARVAAGGDPWLPQAHPASYWNPGFYGCDLRHAAYVGDFTIAPNSLNTGMAFDRVANRLYVCQQSAITRPGGAAPIALIHVFDVGGGDPAAPPPAPPTGLRATAIAATRVELAWDGEGGVSGFLLQRAEDAGGAPGTFVAIATPAAGDSAFSDGSVAPGTAYWYRIKASGEVADSAFSAPVAVSTPASGGGTGGAGTSADRGDSGSRHCGFGGAAVVLLALALARTRRRAAA